MAPNDDVTELTNAAKTWSLEDMLEPADANSKTKNVMDWGYPGHLTKAELDVYVSHCYLFKIRLIRKRNFVICETMI